LPMAFRVARKGPVILRGLFSRDGVALDADGRPQA